MNAILALEDGRCFEGTAFGATGTTTGEICFNTSMTGYQEVITDPSYRGQIVTMTYPQIGNYGINPLDAESRGPHIRALVIGELCEVPSNWRSSQPLAAYLADHGILGIEGIDTRALTKHLRSRGAMRACVSTELSREHAIAAAQASPAMAGMDYVKEVSTRNGYHWEEESRRWVLPNPSIGQAGPYRGSAAAAPPHRRLRFRHQVQHPPPPAPGGFRGGSGDLHRHRRRSAREKPGGNFPL